MAISLGQFKQYGAKATEADRLAKEYAHQQRKEAKRGAFSSLLGGVGGKLLGGAITGALGIASGGLLAPLIGAMSSFGAQKLAHEATRGMGAETSGLVSKSKYGYGEEEAKTLREGLEEQIAASDPTKDPGGLGKQLLKSYVSAAASGGLGNVGKALKGKGTEGLLMGTSVGEAGQEVIGTGKGLLQFGDVAKDTGFTIDEITGAAIPIDKGFEFGSAKDVLGGAGTGLGETLGIGSLWGGEDAEAVTDIADVNEGIGQSYETNFKGGGMVQAKAPTISDYFGMQGVSLGGSNKHSLAEMLGRK